MVTDRHTDRKVDREKNYTASDRDGAVAKAVAKALCLPEKENILSSYFFAVLPSRRGE